MTLTGRQRLCPTELTQAATTLITVRFLPKFRWETLKSRERCLCWQTCEKQKRKLEEQGLPPPPRVALQLLGTGGTGTFHFVEQSKM